MKKTVLIIMTVFLGLGIASAGPVDVNTAKSLGQKFVSANFETTRSAALEHVYTFTDDMGEASFYVYNVGDKGFVMVSADDNFRPIVGYSDEGIFEVNNMSPEMTWYLNAIANGRSQNKTKAVDPEVAIEWNSLATNGHLLSFNGGRGVPYLVQTKWNQSPAPYNSMCPADPQGDGGHDFVGCVATAMSQLMKYWNYPEQGQGSHTYTCVANPYAGYPGHPEYGPQTANFGETTYDWDNMLNSYALGNYTQEQGDAVATICYHCGVAVDMMYGNIPDDGSGAYSADVPAAIYNYFKYTNAAVLRNFSNLNNWKVMLKEQHDLGWPVYHSGSSSEGGHAFICDGYDDNDLFHFNWGWGGVGDAYFVVNEIDYNSSMAAIINFVPADVYSNTAKAPSNVTVTKTSDVAQEATVTWVNPTQTQTNATLASIDQMVVERDGRVIATFDNVTPGASMSYVDSEVPCYSTFEYRVYAIKDGAKGAPGKATESFGPTCEWKAVVTATAMTGWKGGYVHVFDGAGREITSFTMTSNNPQTISFNVTLGRVAFAWKEGTEAVTLSIKIKDANNNVVYEFAQGSSLDIPEGMFYVGNNGCTSNATCDTPGELFANTVDGKVVLSWDGIDDPGYGYNIYRDGLLFELAQTNEFVDETASVGGHCYQVCVLCEGGESEMSNEVCGTAGEGCDPGSNLWYELQANGKPIISWDAPETEGLSGFAVFRKMNDEEYERIKLLGPDKTQYKETKSMQEGNWYYYRVYADYQDIECTSSPFKAKYGNEYFVKMFYSTTGVEEFVSRISLYPNPTKDSFTIEGDNLKNVMVYNALGQLIYSQDCQGDSTVINLGNVETGIYMVKVVTADTECIQKVSVIR